MGHRVKECEDIPLADRMKDDDDLPYSNALLADYKLMGKEYYKFGLLPQKLMKQCCYTGADDSVAQDDGGGSPDSGTIDRPSVRKEDVESARDFQCRGNFDEESARSDFRAVEISSDPINRELANLKGDNCEDSLLESQTNITFPLDTTRRWKRVARSMHVDQLAISMDYGKRKGIFSQVDNVLAVTVNISKKKKFRMVIATIA